MGKISFNYRSAGLQSTSRDSAVFDSDEQRILSLYVKARDSALNRVSSAHGDNISQSSSPGFCKGKMNISESEDSLGIACCQHAEFNERSFQGI